jgi:hypothetical protein
MGFLSPLNRSRARRTNNACRTNVLVSIGMPSPIDSYKAQTTTRCRLFLSFLPSLPATFDLVVESPCGRAVTMNYRPSLVP